VSFLRPSSLSLKSIRSTLLSLTAMPVLTTTSGLRSTSSSHLHSYSGQKGMAPHRQYPSSSSLTLPSSYRSPISATSSRSYELMSTKLSTISSPSTLTSPTYSLASSRSSSSSSTSSYSSVSGNQTSNSYLSKTSGFSSPTRPSVTLTRFSYRRPSIDCNDNNSDSFSLKAPNFPSGLSNLGNTCYMNSVLQALYATDSIRNYIIRNQRTPLMAALGRLFEDMKSRDSYCSPVAFRNQFIRFQPRFRGYDQHDAQEFLRYLLNGLHEEVNISRRRGRKAFDPPKCCEEAWEQYKCIDDSPLVDLIGGQLSSVITCGLCGNVSTCWDPFWDLSLPLPRGRGEVNVERCIREFEALEELDYDEKPICEKCKRPVPATKRLSIERSPSVLILHLKRFTNEGYKLSSPSLLVDPKIKTKTNTYRLYAAVCHHGSSSKSGHYTAYCQYDSRWFHFNDDRVTEVRNFDYERTLEDAYILFYVENYVSSRL